MSNRTIGAAKFKAECLSLIDEIGREGGELTITKRGKPVAVLSAAKPEKPKSLFGALKGSVLYYDDSNEPAGDPNDWHANR